jgi:tripartite-type tricarboxylate transporter receptor subunit TctC
MTWIPRRKFLHLAAGSAALPAVSRMARAETYPSRPVRIVAGFAAGGPADIISRLIAQWLSERLGQPFIVENRPGAGGNLAAEMVAHEAPDGYALVMLTTTNTMSGTFYNNLNYDFVRDIEPVAGFLRSLTIMVVNPSFPANTVPEFIAYAKEHPGKLNMASSGVGALSHLSGELFAMMTGIGFQHVPYRGVTPALTDLLGGQVQVLFVPTPASIEYITSKLRPLAVSSATRYDLLPDIPTVGEFVPGYEAIGFQGIGAPKNTPKAIVDSLNREINAALADAAMKTRVAELGGLVLAASPADFGKFVADNSEKWARVIKFANIKPE